MVLEICHLAHVEHIHHLLLVTKKQDASILAGHVLDFGDDCVDYCGFERICLGVSVTTYSPAAI